MSNLVQVYRKKRRKAALGLLGCVVVMVVSWILSMALLWIAFAYLSGGALGLGLVMLVSAITNQWRISKLKKSRPKYLYESGMGLAFSESRDIEMCDRMAAEGYALVSVNKLGVYKFERAEPEEFGYSVDYSDVKPGKEGFAEYLEIFESGGWKYVCSCEIFHYFKAPKGTTPIYTDNANLAQKYERIRKHTIWGTLGIALAAIAAFALGNVIQVHAIIFMLNIIMHAGAGAALAMAAGVFLTHRRVLRLRRAQDNF